MGKGWIRFLGLVSERDAVLNLDVIEQTIFVFDFFYGADSRLSVALRISGAILINLSRFGYCCFVRDGVTKCIRIVKIF